MSDDSFIREVNEELRQDQAQGAVGPLRPGVHRACRGRRARHGGLCRLGILGRNAGPTASGDDFSQALPLANSGKNDEALAALEALEKDGYGAYPLLARMRAATVLADKGDFAGAVKEFDEVADDTSIPEAIRDMARLRAALILVDNGSYEDVSARVEPLTADTNTLRHSAREALGLSAWKEGKAKDAIALFDQIAADDARAAQHSRARDADVRTDPRLGRRVLTRDELHRRHHRPA